MHKDTLDTVRSLFLFLIFNSLFLLIGKKFGCPEDSRTGFDGTGEYDFEDNNLDVYNICDYRKT